MDIENLRAGIRSLVSHTYADTELDQLIRQCEYKVFEKNEIIFPAGEVCNTLFYIHQGLCRTVLYDSRGTEHTILFALEGHFSSDFSSYIKLRPSTFRIEAVERTEGLLIPRATVESAFQVITSCRQLGQSIIGRYYVHLQELMEARRAMNTLELYNYLGEIYPGIHRRVPQNIIASFLDVSPVHLSRLKSKTIKKV